MLNLSKLPTRCGQNADELPLQVVKVGVDFGEKKCTFEFQLAGTVSVGFSSSVSRMLIETRLPHNRAFTINPTDRITLSTHLNCVERTELI